MAIFSVATKHEVNDETLKAKIAEHFPTDHYEIGRGQWLVAFSGTSKELYNTLFPDDGSSLPINGGIVFLGINGYFGRAPTDMWEWMANKLKTSA